jgi:hypothetical protein
VGPGESYSDVILRLARVVDAARSGEAIRVRKWRELALCPAKF